MNQRTLGKTGLKVSEIGFGGWAVGGPMEAGGVPIGWSNTSDDESLATIRSARDLGVTFFDTSDVYGFGRSESLLGIVLARRRDEFVISTKVGLVKNSDGDLVKDFSRKHILAAIIGSLRRLRTDYLDLYLGHNPDMDVLRHGEFQETMDRLQEEGKIRFWGLSVMTPRDGIEVIENGWGHAIQVLYNVLNQSPAETLFPLAIEKNVGVIARVPLASGLLSGKYRGDSTFPTNDVRQNFLTTRRLQEAVDRVDEVKSLVGDGHYTLAQASIRFVLEHDAVATTIPGARNVRQVESNVAASNVTLPEESIRKLRERLGDYNFYERHSIRV